MESERKEILPNNQVDSPSWEKQGKVSKKIIALIIGLVVIANILIVFWVSNTNVLRCPVRKAKAKQAVLLKDSIQIFHKKGSE
ncbi:MAG: hypothetical protein HQK83_11055 [Fibrobacteria bacterium]|nr:hypothetical protein [Fibrobacteria bacterium]